MRSSRSKTRQPSSAGLAGDVRLEFDAIGTRWQVDVPAAADHGRDEADDLKRLILDRIEAFDRTYSRFREDSAVARMARQAGDYPLPEDAADMIGLYRELYDITDGAMTPLIGQVLHDAGYDASYGLRPGHLHRPPAWDEVLAFDAGVLRVARPALLDFGAAGKGYLADIVAGLLRDVGYDICTVDAGGDMVHRGPAPLAVGLEHPEFPDRAVGVAHLGGGALCGSAGNRRAWAGFHHVIDPASLASPRHIRALWVTAASGLLADALTTALYFVSPERLQERYTFEYAIVYDDYRLRASDGFPAEFFIAGEDD